MSSIQKKNLKPKFDRLTQEQLSCFLTFCKTHPILLSVSNSTDYLKYNQEKLWQDLAKILNDMAGPSKTASKWRDTLLGWRNRLHQRTRTVRSETKAVQGHNKYGLDMPGEASGLSGITLTPKKTHPFLARYNDIPVSYSNNTTDIDQNVSKMIAKPMIKKETETRINEDVYKWRKVFSEYLLCELNRYSDEDAQLLKTHLTMTCLNFKPQNSML